MDFKKFTDDLETRLSQFLTTSTLTPLVKQIEKQINTVKPRRSKASSSFRGRLINFAESLHARGEPGISVDHIIRLLDVPSHFVDKRAVCRRLRRLEEYLEERGIHTLLVNARYFEAHEAVHSIEAARKLLPIGHAAFGLRFVREKNDMLVLASLQAKLIEGIKRCETSLRPLLAVEGHLSNDQLRSMITDTEESLIHLRKNLEFVNLCIAARIETDIEFGSEPE